MATIALMACSSKNDPDPINNSDFKKVSDIAKLYKQSPQNAETQIMQWGKFEKEYSGNGYSEYMVRPSERYEEINIWFSDVVFSVDYFAGKYSNCHNEILRWLKSHGDQIVLDGETYKFHHAEQFDETSPTEYSTISTDYQYVISYIETLSYTDDYYIYLEFLTDEEASYYNQHGKLSPTAKAISLGLSEWSEDGDACGDVAIGIGYSSYGK